MLKLVRVAFILLPSCLLSLSALASTEEFTWEGEIIPGQSLEIKGVNGSVEAAPSSDSRVQVTAIKTGRRDDPRSVQIEVVPHAGGVTVCAVYPGARNRCEPGPGGNLGSQNNDVEVEFRVAVPSGVNFVGRTVNGDVLARDIDSNGAGYTVNGDVGISCNGVGRAKTVNGSVEVAMYSVESDESLAFETVNGSVSLTLPANANADLRAGVLNGEIDSEFPLTVKGKWGPKQASATLGSGGLGLELKTVNGDIKLTKMAE